MAETLLRDIDLKTLRLLVSVCDFQNMSRAARHANIETSAISKRIAQLEADLGTPLLERARRGVHPTEAGLAVLEHARQVLFTLDRIADDAASFGAGVRGHVRLVATASAVAESLLDDVASFMRQPDHRNIRIDIEERTSLELVRQVRDGRASIGVCWNGTDLQGLQHREYRRDRLALAVHPDHPLARRRSLRFEQTLEHDHVGLPPASAVNLMLGRAAARAGARVSFRVIVSNFDAAFRVVAANLAISVVPVQIGEQYARLLDVKLVPLTDPWTERTFVVCFTDYDALPPASQRLVDHLVERAARAGRPAARSVGSVGSARSARIAQRRRPNGGRGP